MNHFIKAGGLGIIAAVFGIFIFILSQILPLFKGAEVRPLATYPLGVGARACAVLGIDEWSERPFLLDREGDLYFLDAKSGQALVREDLGLPESVEFSAAAYDQRNQKIVYATRQGTFTILSIAYEPDFSGPERVIRAAVKAGPFFEIGKAGLPVLAAAYGSRADGEIVAVLQDAGGRREAHAVFLKSTRTLLGEGEAVESRFDLSAEISGEPELIAVNRQGDSVVVATGDGRVHYFFYEGDDLKLRQTFSPFEDTPNQRIESMDYLLGGVSLVFTHPDGVNRVFSLFRPEGSDWPRYPSRGTPRGAEDSAAADWPRYPSRGTPREAEDGLAADRRLFGRIKEFGTFGAGAEVYASSLRNKAFLIARGHRASLRYSTTEKIRWEARLPFEVKKAVISGKYDRIAFLDKEGNLHLYRLKDPHPEAGLEAFFGKLWYEGYSEPGYTWQSTGGTDDFEPKLSLVPLIVGSLKGTFYALLFALPIAILAAVYTSQFAAPRIKAAVKPVMEIMASLPSVVLGFLAALWLAPLVESRVPSLLVAVIGLPVAALLIGTVWSALPPRLRAWAGAGTEVFILAPFLFLFACALWQLGPWLERLLFVVEDPTTGAHVADFRLWWPRATGASFEQRNSLVVGFVMGFAVIPIIFTITEDALSNVSPALRSASLALGASRWQTAMRVVIPSASAGILSAVMIGFGRAVGETMIVVMATGNTPIMDFNIFSGMRTLSANIAVELPEAPFEGTLYRALFLGALVLFLMTFVVNTLAEILRERLRSKYVAV